MRVIGGQEWPLATWVHLLGIDPILGVQVLHLAIGEHPVKLVLDLVLGPQPCSKRQALLLPGQLEQIGTLPHYGGTTSGHFKYLFLGRVPCDDVELFHLGLAEQASGAAAEDGRRGVGIQFRRGEANRGFFCRCFLRHGPYSGPGRNGGFG